MTVITEDLVLKAFETLIAKFGPDYVYTDHYQECTYADDAGNPACIVGQVICIVDRAAFEDVAVSECNAETGVDTLVLNGLIDSDSRVTTTALQVAQEFQDTGSTWAVAVKAATYYFGHHGDPEFHGLDITELSSLVAERLAVETPVR